MAKVLNAMKGESGTAALSGDYLRNLEERRGKT